MFIIRPDISDERFAFAARIYLHLQWHGNNAAVYVSEEVNFCITVSFVVAQYRYFPYQHNVGRSRQVPDAGRPTTAVDEAAVVPGVEQWPACSFILWRMCSVGLMVCVVVVVEVWLWK